jgi:membrane-associated phospholipid phosphatase
MWWDGIDLSAFHFFNNSLKDGTKWQSFWAIANWRFSDTPQFILIFSIGYYWIFKQKKTVTKQRIMEYFIFIVLCFFVNRFFKLILVFLDYQRLSPTKVIDDVFRLSHTITCLTTKDSSNTAFPGDHGFVLICSAVFYWVKGGFRLGLISSILFIPFLFPRMVAGAHWLTDLLVGSIFLSLVSISLYFGTPAQSSVPLWLIRKIEKRFPAIDSFMNRISSG